MNEFCAAMGICSLKYLEENIAQRKKVREKYTEYLSDVQGIKINSVQDNTESNNAYFPVLFTDEADRDKAFQSLGEEIFLSSGKFL